MHDLEYDHKYSVFKVVVYIKFFWSSNFLLVGAWLVGGHCIWSVVGWSVIGGRWSVGWLVGGR